MGFKEYVGFGHSEMKGRKKTASVEACEHTRQLPWMSYPTPFFALTCAISMLQKKCPYFLLYILPHLMYYPREVDSSVHDRLGATIKVVQNTDYGTN